MKTRDPGLEHEAMHTAFLRDGLRTGYAEFCKGFTDALDWMQSQQPSTSDPKHLPPRDCLVLYQDESDRKAGDDPYWIQVNFQEADGETVYDDITPRTVGHDDQWVCAYSREVIEVESVITWRELPEVE